MSRALMFVAINVASWNPCAATAQTQPAPPVCDALAAEVNQLSAQLGGNNDAVQERAADMMAAQSAYADAAKAQRRSGAVGDAISSVIGSIVPGGEIVNGAAAALRGAAPRSSTPSPKATPDMAPALIEQGNIAVRIGTLLDQRAALGCR